MSLCESQFDIRNDGGGKFSVWFDGRCIAVNLSEEAANKLVADIVYYLTAKELAEILRKYLHEEEIYRIENAILQRISEEIDACYDNLLGR
ncbi:PqqD family protein [uncultured Thiomicrorhabdus sp.]